MGLDIDLYKIKWDTSKLHEFFIKANENEDELDAIAKALDLPQDIEHIFWLEWQKDWEKDTSGGSEIVKKIDIPSQKYPEHHFNIGHWRPGSLDCVLKYVLKEDLYSAFPEGHLETEIIKPDWKKAYMTMQELYKSFKARGFYDKKFLEASGITSLTSIRLLNKLGVILKPKWKKQLLKVIIPWDWAKSQFGEYLQQLEIIIETIEYVLDQPDFESYMLMWH